MDGWIGGGEEGFDAELKAVVSRKLAPKLVFVSKVRLSSCGGRSRGIPECERCAARLSEFIEPVAGSGIVVHPGVWWRWQETYWAKCAICKTKVSLRTSAVNFGDLDKFRWVKLGWR